MADRNYTLFVAAYDDESLRHPQAASRPSRSLDDTVVMAAVVFSVTPRARWRSRSTAAATSPPVPPWARSEGSWSDVRPAPVACRCGRRRDRRRCGAIAKRHAEKSIGVDAEEWLPAGSSAIAAVVDDLYLDRVDKAVGKATKKVSKAIDKGDYDAVVKAVNEGDEKVIEAAES